MVDGPIFCEWDHNASSSPSVLYKCTCRDFVALCVHINRKGLAAGVGVEGDEKEGKHTVECASRRPRTNVYNGKSVNCRHDNTGAAAAG